MRYLALFLFCILVTSNAEAGKNDTYTYITMGCNEVLEAHSRTTIDSQNRVSGVKEIWRVIGYIQGFVTATNYHKEGAENWFKGKAPEILTWIASFCRSYPSLNLHDALLAYSDEDVFIPLKK